MKFACSNTDGVLLYSFEDLAKQFDFVQIFTSFKQVIDVKEL